LESDVKFTAIKIAIDFLLLLPLPMQLFL